MYGHRGIGGNSVAAAILDGVGTSDSPVAACAGGGVAERYDDIVAVIVKCLDGVSVLEACGNSLCQADGLVVRIRRPGAGEGGSGVVNAVQRHGGSGSYRIVAGILNCVSTSYSPITICASCDVFVCHGYLVAVLIEGFYCCIIFKTSCNCVCKADRLISWIGRPGAVEHWCNAVADTLLIGDGHFIVACVFYYVGDYYGVQASILSLLECSGRTLDGDIRASIGEGEALCLKCVASACNSCGYGYGIINACNSILCYQRFVRYWRLVVDDFHFGSVGACAVKLVFDGHLYYIFAIACFRHCGRNIVGGKSSSMCGRRREGYTWRTDILPSVSVVASCCRS